VTDCLPNPSLNISLKLHLRALRFFGGDYESQRKAKLQIQSAGCFEIVVTSTRPHGIMSQMMAILKVLVFV
jgi:hypothetical protein